MSQATYVFAIDFDKDLTYGNALSDVTDYVISARWIYGATDSYQDFAPPARMALVLSNSAGDFSAEDSGATYYGLLQKGLLVRVRATLGVTTVDYFVGRIQQLDYQGDGVYQAKSVLLTIGDFMDDLLNEEPVMPLFLGVAPGQIIRDVFDRAGLVFPYVSSFWVLGEAGNSELGSTTIPFDGTVNSLTTSIGNGRTLLAYTGDKPIGSIQTYMRDLVASECGGLFFYAARNGAFTFLERTWAANPSIAATLTDDNIDEAEYIVDDDVLNDVSITYYPRRVGTSNTVLWSQEGVIELRPGQQREVNGRYFDPNNPSISVGGLYPSPMTAGIDYIARQRADGSGLDLTSFLVVSSVLGGSSAEIALQNTHPTRNLFVTTLQVRGTPLYSNQPETVRVTDAASQIKYGIRRKSITLRLVDSQELAENYATSLLAQFAFPTPRLRSITWLGNKSDANMLNSMQRFVGEVIRVNSARLNHDQNYLIVGEQHQVNAGGEDEHRTTLILKPASREVYWILGETGYSELGSTTRPAF